jgi:hypothetical protein|tara:strand:- start:26 stop:925 length:900 start_codon:yes stop_codon:yes gene_type:complete
MFVYWGAKTSGKAEFAYNGGVNGYGHIWLKVHSVKVWDNPRSIVSDDDWEIEYDKFIYTRDNTGKVLEYQKSDTVRGNYMRGKMSREINPQIDPNQKNIIPVGEMAATYGGEPYSIYKFPFNLKSMRLDTQKLILGVTEVVNEYNPNSKSIVRQLLALPHKHIIPYRKYTDPRKLLHRVHQFKHITYGDEYKDVFDLYDRNKDEFFKYMSTFDRSNRDMEKILVDADKDYQFFDLDNDTYCDSFNWSVSLPEGISAPYYNLDDPTVLERYNKAVDMCQDYIDTLKISDTRLSYRSKDGI